MTLEPHGAPPGLLVCTPAPLVLVLAKGTVLGRTLQSWHCHFKAVWLWSKHLTFRSLSFLVSNRGYYCVTLLFEDEAS